MDYFGTTTKITVFIEKGRRCSQQQFEYLNSIVMSERFSLDTLYRGHALVLSTVFVIGVFSRFFVKWHGQEGNS